MKSYMFNTKELKHQNDNIFKSLEMYFDIIGLLLGVLAFYQLILIIDANLSKQMWQIGEMRAMGLTNQEVERMTLEESSANVLSAAIIGILSGIILGVESEQVLLAFWELPASYKVYWKLIGCWLVAAFVIVCLGTKLCIRIVRSKSIANILKGF